MTSAAAAPIQIDLSLPAAWVDATPVGDDSGEGFRSTVARMADLQIPAAVPSTIRYLLATLAAQQQDALMTSYYLDAVAGDEETGLDFLFASMAVLCQPVAGEGTMADLRAAVSSSGGAESLPLLDEISLGDLPAIRRRSVRSAPAEGVREQLDVRYYAPVMHHGVLLTVLFATPDTELEAEWLELFDSIAATLQVAPAGA